MLDAELYKETIAARVKETRTEQGFDQQAFAKAMNAHASQVSRWESGKYSIDLYTAYWISRVLKVPMEKLFGD